MYRQIVYLYYPESMQENQPPLPPSFREALSFWWKLGWISFDGPAGQIAIMHAYLVKQKRWISNHRFLHTLNYCMLLPGPEAQQLATYTGWLLHGIRGGVAAGLLFILPSILILALLSLVYSIFGSVPWVSAIFDGMQPAVLALVVIALVRLARKALKGSIPWILACLSLILTVFLHIPFPYILLAAAVVGLLTPDVGAQPDKLAGASDEIGYLHHGGNTPPAHRLGLRSIFLTVAAVIMLWLLPILAIHFLHPNPAFWEQLSFFFSQTALITFGGAYAVLPFVADSAVNQFGWLTAPQMADGLALGESTPGPLIMVLAFVGYMAGWQYGGHDPIIATLALLVTVYFTFLPGFGFVLAGAPVIERTRSQGFMVRMMRFIPAVILGVIAQLLLMLGKAVLFSGEAVSIDHLFAYGILWLLASLVAMWRFRVPVAIWIPVSGVAVVLFWVLKMYLALP